MDGSTATAGYFDQSRPEMLGYIPARRGRVLEIGCSEGRFGASIPGTQEVWGIEPSAAAAEAEKRLARVFHGTFEEAEPELPPAYFDVVVCNDVIEHMPDHARFLQAIQKHIAPGGMLVGSIPNVRYYRNMFQYLLEKDWHYTDSGILDRTHTAFFTEKSLRATLERTGFRVVQMRGFNAYGRQPLSGRDRLYHAAAKVLAWGTAGYFADIAHLQFAFQAVPADART